MQSLGSDNIRRQFQITDHKILINHGSYGRSPLPVLEKRYALVYM